MLLTKDGVTMEVFHPADIARLKHVGYTEVKAEPVAVKGLTAEAQNAEAIKEVNAPKGKKGGDK